MRDRGHGRTVITGKLGDRAGTLNGGVILTVNVAEIGAVGSMVPSFARGLLSVSRLGPADRP